MMENAAGNKSSAGKGRHRPDRFLPKKFRRPLLRLGLERLPIVLAVLIFLVEVFDMFLITLLPTMSRSAMAVLDSAILLVALSPVYYFVIRPILKERKRAEEEIRLLSRQLIRAEEKIRKNVARDLHDEFGQVLTALQFGVETVCKSLPPGNEHLDAHCGRLSQMIAHLGNHVRDVTAELRPSMLDNIGLVSALRWHARQFETMHPGVTVLVDAEDDAERWPPETEIALYRVCQEGLNNVGKHARASQVAISLRQMPDVVILSVRDNGVGFEAERGPDAIAPPNGFGILGMRERIADLGGQFEVVSQRGKGTEIWVSLPLVEERRCE